VIIGATSGLGQAILEHVADHTGVDDITLVGRSEEKLTKILKDVIFKRVPAKLNTITHDFADELTPESHYALTTCIRDATHVYYCVGFCEFASLQKTGEKMRTTRNMIEANLTRAMAFGYQCHNLFPVKGNRKLIFIGSSAAVIPIRFYDSYSATKAGLRQFVRCVRGTFREKGNLCSIVHPANFESPGYQKENKTKPSKLKMFEKKMAPPVPAREIASFVVSCSDCTQTEYTNDLVTKIFMSTRWDVFAPIRWVVLFVIRAMLK